VPSHWTNVGHYYGIYLQTKFCMRVKKGCALAHISVSQREVMRQMRVQVKCCSLRQGLIFVSNDVGCCIIMSVIGHYNHILIIAKRIVRLSASPVVYIT
jgi:hypothetical protein